MTPLFVVLRSNIWTFGLIEGYMCGHIGWTWGRCMSCSIDWAAWLTEARYHVFIALYWRVNVGVFRSRFDT
jgi:hypothetical protein